MATVEVKAAEKALSQARATLASLERQLATGEQRKVELHSRATKRRSNASRSSQPRRRARISTLRMSLAASPKPGGASPRLRGK
jgi:hypothetical protein